MDRLHRAYRRAESQLISVLERRKGEVQTFYGDLMLADGVYGGSQSRRWKVDWNKTPQPIQVKLMSLRGVRDKLPGQGHFHYCVSLWYNVVSLIALSLYYERLCLSNGCCVILINDHWYSNLAKENFFFEQCFLTLGGRYVLMVSLYNRLGGHNMRWSKLKGQTWGAATLPINHDGRYYNVEMKVSFV